MKRYFNILVLLFGMIFLFSSFAAAKNMIQIKGSDTLINLVQILSETYMTKNPGKMIAVTGGGSGTGIAALIDGKCDIADAARGIKEKEIKLANDRGVDPKAVQFWDLYVFCRARSQRGLFPENESDEWKCPDC